MANRRGVFCAAIFLVATPAVAAEWKVANLALGDHNRGVTFVDTASLQVKRGKTRFRSEQFFERPQAGYGRVVATAEVDCTTLSLTVIREAFYSGSVPIAFNSRPRTSNHYSSDSSTHWLLRRVCDGDYLSGNVPNPELYSTRIFAVDWSRVPDRLSIKMPVVAERAPRTQVALAAAGTSAKGRQRQ